MGYNVICAAFSFTLFSADSGGREVCSETVGGDFYGSSWIPAIRFRVVDERGAVTTAMILLLGFEVHRGAAVVRFRDTCKSGGWLI